MNNAPKPKDEKKFAQISPETVLHLAESVGLANLSPSVARALSEDASYRCRELASLCGQFLRQSKKRKLTTQDVERAMKWYNAEPVYGHGAGSNETGYSKINDTTKTVPGSSSLFVPDEKLIDLRPYALMQSPVILTAKLTIQGSWLSLEGTLLPENEESKTVEFPPAGAISQPLLQFYSAIVNGVLNNCDQYFQKILEEIGTNTKLSPLLPYLVSFIRNGLQRHIDNQNLIRRLLSLLQALFSNSAINLSPKPYLSHLVTALLSSLIVERAGRERKDFESLFYNSEHVDQAAGILKQVLNHWATPVNQLRSQTLKALKEYLRDTKISFSSHFGALSALIALGPTVLEECLLPHFEFYTNNLEEKFQMLETQILNARSCIEIEKKRRVLLLLKSMFLIAARLIISSWVLTNETHTSDDEVDRKRFETYQMFVNYFGDALCSCQISPVKNQTSKSATTASTLIGNRPPLVRKLRPISGYVPPKKYSFIKTEIKMETDDFSLYNDMEMPNDIFEPDLQPKVSNGRALPVLLDKPEPLSKKVLLTFDTCKNVTANPNPKVCLRVGGMWPTSRLKRKQIGSLKVGNGFKGYGVIGRRWTKVPPEQKPSSIINSSFFEYIL